MKSAFFRITPVALLVFNFVIFCELNGQNVHIPDSQFYQALIERFVDVDMDGQISVDEASQVHQLNIRNEDIKDLTGIEAFANLDVLNISENPISRLNLPASIELDVLNMKGTQIEELHIENWQRLHTLDASSSPLLRLVIPPANNICNLYLNDNYALKTLVIGNASKLVEFNSTPFHTPYALDTLIVDSLFQDLVVLNDNVNQHFELRNVFNILQIENRFPPNEEGTMVIDNAPQTNLIRVLRSDSVHLFNLPALEVAILNQIETRLLDLSDFPLLHHFSVTGNVDSFIVQHLEGIDGISLHEFKLQSQYVAIESMPNLQELTIGEGNIHHLTISSLPKLTRLRIEVNHVERFEMNDVPKLEFFDSSVNKIEHFDPNDYPMLRRIDLHRCIVRTIDIKNNHQLEVLRITSDSLRTLDLSSISELRELLVGNAPYCFLKLRQLPKLENPVLHRLQKLEFNDGLAFSVSDEINISSLILDTLVLDNISDTGKIHVAHFHQDVFMVIQNSLHVTEIESQTNRHVLHVINLPNLDEVLLSQLEEIKLINVSSLRKIQIYGAPELQTINLNPSASNALEYLAIWNTGMNALQIDALDVRKLTWLDLHNNKLEDFHLRVAHPNMTVDLSENLLTTFEYSDAPGIVNLSCDLSDNLLEYFILPDVEGFTNFELENNELKAIFTRQDDLTMGYNDNPDLSYVCVVPELFHFHQLYVRIALDLVNCVVDSTCTLAPPARFSTIEASSYWKLTNADSCDNHQFFPFATYDVSIDQLGFSHVFSSNENPTKILLFYEGDVEITAQCQSPLSQSEFVEEHHIVSDDVIQTSFCFEVEDYCDMGVQVVGFDRFSPGFETRFDILVQNVGSIAAPVEVTLNYNANVQQYDHADMPPASVSGDFITWDLPMIEAFENEKISVYFRLNSPMDTPPLNAGDILEYSVEIESDCYDSDSENNVSSIELRLTNSFDPNDKTCLEGSVLDVSRIGGYVHYLLRCENTGNAEATHVTIRDEIDESTFDIGSIQIVDASHPVQLKVEGNVASFIFRDIDLPFEDMHNDAYVVFKIKSGSALSQDDELHNTADIFFDYNYPIRTNTTVTVFELLNGRFETPADNYVACTPNPIWDDVRVECASKFDRMSIFTLNGRLIATKQYAQGANFHHWNLSDIPIGNYLLQLTYKNESVGRSTICIH